MGEKLKVCIIGCGRIAQSHASAMAECDDIELAAILERTDEKRLAFKEKFGVPHDFADLETALRSGTFTAVDICMPNFLHKEYAIKCANAKKHILLEKPMANTYSDCLAIDKAVRENSCTFMIGQSRRYYDAVQRSKREVDSGRIGQLTTITALLMGYLPAAPTPWWNDNEKSGGLMIPLWGNHIFDYILYVFGQSPETVFCQSYSHHRGWAGEDEATIILTFSEGRHATVKMSWNTRLDPGQEWKGQKKMLNSSDILYERYIQGTEGTLKLEDETCLKLNGIPLVEGVQTPSNFALELEEFAASIREKRRPMTDAAVGMENVLVQQAALLSAKLHRPVNVEQLREGRIENV